MFSRFARIFKDDASSPLKVKSIDFCINKNGESHHTEEYDLMEKPPSEGGRLVVRRGQVFHVKVTFDREYDKHEDRISFLFTYANAQLPSYGNGTQISVPLQEEEPESTVTSGRQWLAWKDEEDDGDTLTFRILSPSTTLVGQWKMDIDTKLDDIEYAASYEVGESFYLLFNPWCKDDDCYMEDDSHRKEYVLNDSGVIWRGATNCVQPSPWIYGQFEENILDCCLHVLHNVSRLRPMKMGDPVEIVRAISSGLNSANNRGVLAGCWGDASDGTSPLKWIGSIKIIQQFFRTKECVRYGQCWVFAGIFTTMCRTLGIPARPVTNFASAHDTQGSQTIDYFFNDEGESVEYLNSDSIWNFHVWVETWMTRPDLEPGDYSGWQAVDATPQEESEGLYRCGPASIKGIRRGEIRKPYDATFVYAEINADEVYWKVLGTGQPLKFVGKNTTNVGRFISTKAVGKDEREDITLHYKPEEGGTLERDVNLRALESSGTSLSRCYVNESRGDIEFKLEEMVFVEIGTPFTVKLHIESKDTVKSHFVSGTLRLSSVQYTGKHKASVTFKKFETPVPPNSKKIITMEVSPETYLPYCKHFSGFCMSALAKVEGTDFEYFARDDFKVGKSGLQIQTEGELKAGHTFTVTAKFCNTLSIPLTHGQFHFEASGILGEEETKKCKGDIQPGEEATATFTVKARICGEKTVAVVFNCDQLPETDGHVNVDIASRLS